MANTIHIHEIPQELDPMEMDGSELLVVSNPDSEMNNYETNKLSINKLSQFVNRDGGSSSGGLSLDQIYPVGSIYITVSKTFNPNEVFEGTTWSVIGDGRCLWGCSATSSNVGINLKAIFPTHTHTYQYANANPRSDLDKDSSDAEYATRSLSYTATSTGSDIGGLSSEILTGTTLRPPSIGVIFWQRTN